MVITWLADTEKQSRAEDVSDGMCCTLELAILLCGLVLPIRLLLMDVTWRQLGLFTCLESNRLVI